MNVLTYHVYAFYSGSYGTIDLNLVYDDVNLLLVVNVLKARVSESRMLMPWNFDNYDC